MKCKTGSGAGFSSEYLFIYFEQTMKNEKLKKIRNRHANWTQFVKKKLVEDKRSYELLSCCTTVFLTWSLNFRWSWRFLFSRKNVNCYNQCWHKTFRNPLRNWRWIGISFFQYHFEWIKVSKIKISGVSWSRTWTSGVQTSDGIEEFLQDRMDKKYLKT